MSRYDRRLPGAAQWAAAGVVCFLAALLLGTLITTPRPAQAQASSDATLSALALEDADENAIALDPGFVATTTTYTASVRHGVEVLTLAPTTSAAAATVEYLDANGLAIRDQDSTEDDHQVRLALGANTIRVRVTAEDMVTTRTYTVTVNRSDEVWSATLTLRDLGLGGTIGCANMAGLEMCSNSNNLSEDEFTYGGTDYQVTFAKRLSADELQFSVSPVWASSTHRLTFHAGSRAYAFVDADAVVDEATYTSTYWDNPGLSWRVPGSVGDTVTLKLTEGPPSSVATLSALTLKDAADNLVVVNPGFATATTSYAALVASTVSQITLAPTTTDEHATVEYLDEDNVAIADADGAADDHQVPLNLGDNTINVKVTAEDATTTQTYTVVVRRLPPDETTPPTFVSAETDETGEFVTITFSEDIVINPLVLFTVETSTFSPHYFVRGVLDLTIDGRREVTQEWFALEGRELTLRVQIPLISSSQAVSISYDNILANSLFAAGTGLFLDAAGNAATTFSDEVVTNRSTLTTTETAPAGPEFSVTEMTLVEGQGGTFTVTLPSQPSGEVTVSLFAFPTNAIEVTTPAGKNLYGASIMTFDQDSWNIPQTATLSTSQDHDSFPAWALLYGFVGEGSPGYLRSVTSFFALIADDDPPLIITGSDLVPFPENGTGTVATYSVEGTASWSLHGPDKDAFSIDRNTGVLSFKSAPDFEQPSDVDGDNVYLVSLLASRSPSTGFKVVAVTVVNIDEQPVFASTSTTREVPENSPSGTDVGDPVAALDDPGDTPTHTLTGTDAASFDIEATSGQIKTRSGVTYDHETRSRYSVTVNVSDGVDEDGNADASIDDSIAVTINITDANDPPEFPATETGQRSLPENSRPGTNVGAPVSATDEDGDARTYTLAGAHADVFEIVESSGQIRTKAGETYDYEMTPTYFVTVNVSDGKDASGTEDMVVDDQIAVTVMLTDVDEAPEFDGDDSVTLAENGSTLVGSYTARDPEGTLATWLPLTGADARFFEFDAGTGALSFIETPDYDPATNGGHAPEYRVTLRASDEGNKVGSLPVTVTLTDVPEPPVIAGPDTVTVNEGHTGILGTYTKRDPEGASTNWAVVAQTAALTGADADHFDFDKANGRLTFAATPDYESPADSGGDNTYQVTLNTNDGSLNSRYDITVNVANLEELGSLMLGAQRAVNGVSLDATLTDPDVVATQTWKWQRAPSASGPWTDITGADAPSYTPSTDDINEYLRAHVAYTDGSGTDEVTLVAATSYPTVNDALANDPPTPPDPLPAVPDVPENASAGRSIGRVVFTDPEGERLTYSLDPESDEFAINPNTGQITVKPGAAFDYEDTDNYSVTVRAADPFGADAAATLDIGISDVNEPPDALDDAPLAFDEDTSSPPIDVLANDTDPESDGLTVTSVTRPSRGSATVNSDGTITYTPNANYHGADSFMYSVQDDGSPQLSSTATVSVIVSAVNDAPTFASTTAERSVAESAGRDDAVGAPVTASDIDTGDALTYSLSGPDAGRFDIDPDSGQITVGAGASFDIATRDTYEVTVTVDDGSGGSNATASVAVTITVTAGSVGPLIVFGGGGGGGPSGPVPSTVDFEWTVEHDIEELANSHEQPSGSWSDGVTLWLLDNPDGAGDAVYAYDLETGERVDHLEFDLDERNRAPRGVWSDGMVIWVSDSGQDRLFAHDIATGERTPERDIELAGRNADPRGIWSDGETMWVLDGRRDALFAYDLGSSALLGECTLDPANDEPRGIWSDRTTVWVSNHDPKRLFAYRLPTRAELDAAGEDKALERVQDEEFTQLSKAGNNSPRGLWSDGDVMYVADANDGKAYSYNMPDAIDARLASLELTGVDIGEFSPLRYDYTSETIPHGNIATLTAVPAQEGATVKIEPPDHDGDPENGHHLRLLPGLEITVTVTSEDRSRERVYRLLLGGEEPTRDEEPTGDEDAAELAPNCLRGAVAVGFSLLVFEGGSLEDLVSCAQLRHVTALYALSDGEYVAYIFGAPEFVNERFGELYAGGVPALTPLTAKSEGPATPAPPAPEVTEPFTACMRGAIGEGFSLVLYEGGSIDDLAACAEGLGVGALYVLDGGIWVSYILGAPEFVNQSFRELFTDGIPAAMPLTVQGDGL